MPFLRTPPRFNIFMKLHSRGKESNKNALIKKETKTEERSLIE